jgi:hypothetical protein
MGWVFGLIFATHENLSCIILLAWQLGPNSHWHTPQKKKKEKKLHQ